MPRAEVGSSKYIANKMKSKGLQRLRWYCQPCEKQCRDENGFKCHTQSESHVRQMMLIGENPNRAISDYSNQFHRDFVQQLKTGHGTKAVHMNHFYQEYIANKEHVHMNSTRWKSLTEYAKYLGREGVCKVEETDKGLHVAWIDNSPEALRRQDAIRKKERMERGDEEREQQMIREQVERAQAAARPKEQLDDDSRKLERAEGEKFTMSLGGGPKPERRPPTPPLTTSDEGKPGDGQGKEDGPSNPQTITPPAEDRNAFSRPKPLALSKGGGGGASVLKGGSKDNKTKNVFAKSKSREPEKQRLGLTEQPKKMSEAERIMRDEMERKKRGSGGGGPGFKRMKLG